MHLLALACLLAPFLEPLGVSIGVLLEKQQRLLAFFSATAPTAAWIGAAGANDRPIRRMTGAAGANSWPVWRGGCQRPPSPAHTKPVRTNKSYFWRQLRQNAQSLVPAAPITSSVGARRCVAREIRHHLLAMFPITTPTTGIFGAVGANDQPVWRSGCQQPPKLAQWVPTTNPFGAAGANDQTVWRPQRQRPHDLARPLHPQRQRPHVPSASARPPPDAQCHEAARLRPCYFPDFVVK